MVVMTPSTIMPPPTCDEFCQQIQVFCDNNVCPGLMNGRMNTLET